MEYIYYLFYNNQYETIPKILNSQNDIDYFDMSFTDDLKLKIFLFLIDCKVSNGLFVILDVINFVRFNFKNDITKLES